MGEVAYRLDLPAEFSQIHNTFQVPRLRKCVADETTVVTLEDIQVDASLHYIEWPIVILDRKVKVFEEQRSALGSGSVATSERVRVDLGAGI